MTNTTACTRGHPYTMESTQWKRRSTNGVVYRECKICTKARHQDLRRGIRSKWGLTQRMLNKASIEYEDISECPICPASTYTGKRRPLVDDGYGDMVCVDCRRGPPATVIFADVVK